MKKARGIIVSSITLGLAVWVNAATGSSNSNTKSTAWANGQFHVDTGGVLSRSEIVLSRPNEDAGEAMPLGNGRLGVAVWSQEGLTAQLNRADTLPDRLSPGQVILPGLAELTHAGDYSGRLDLYNGEFHEQGGGMGVVAYVQPGTDTLIFDVSGAPAEKTQTALLRLWEPRSPRTTVEGAVGMLSQSWIDNERPESSGRAFGSLSAITADGRDVSARVKDSRTIELSFKPYQDGHFRILVAAPHFDGRQNRSTVVHAALVDRDLATHRTWWHGYWNRAATIRITSADGSGEYMENLRNIYLFIAAAEKGTEYPGSQAGVADMVSSARDVHRWDSSSFWHWNLRMEVAANLGAGVPELNAPYFNLYRENLTSIEQWTKRHMEGRPGACVPETMRFNGRGIEYEASWKPVSIGYDCGSEFKPYYNSRTLTTGAEVSLWIWEQYLATNDRTFLAANYPVMAASARFLLAYQKPGPDGLLHTSPSNAHETQWDVKDPTTDIAAARSLYPAVIQAATLLGRDADLVSRLQAAVPKIPPFPRTRVSGERTLLTSEEDGAGQDMIAESYLPEAKNQNAENIGLEPVWPYNLIGDNSPLFALARRTYEHRLFSGVADWSFDPVQAARLGLGSQVKDTLVKITESSQHSPNGLANWDKQYGEFYVEQVGVVALALQEMLAQQYDGLLRIVPAVPPGWDVDGSVFIRGKAKLNVQTRDGVVTTAVIETGIAQRMRVRNPWPGEQVDVVLGATGQKVVKADASPVLSFQAIASGHYLMKRHAVSMTEQRFAQITGERAHSARRLGKVKIGLDNGS